MQTVIHERADGALVEYRRHPWDPVILHMEGRVLRRDGTPYDERWYRTGDSELLRLQEAGSDVVKLLAAQRDVS
jgi:hypothetical protein